MTPDGELPPGVRLRPYRSEDYEAVRAFVLETLEGEFGLEYRRKDLEAIEAEYEPPGGMFLLALLETGELVGTVAVKDIPAPANPAEGAEGVRGPLGMLRRMYVAPEWRGRGLGRALYQRAEEHCRQRGFRAIYLDTDPKMEVAREFYLRRGFVPLEEPLVEPGCGHEGCLDYYWKPLPHTPL